jgi:hypothetical protein
MTNVDRLRCALEEGTFGIEGKDGRAEIVRTMLNLAEWIDVEAGRIVETGRISMAVVMQIEYLGARVSAWRIGDNGGKA